MHITRKLMGPQPSPLRIPRSGAAIWSQMLWSQTPGPQTAWHQTTGETLDWRDLGLARPADVGGGSGLARLQLEQLKSHVFAFPEILVP